MSSTGRAGSPCGGIADRGGGGAAGERWAVGPVWSGSGAGGRRNAAVGFRICGAGWGGRDPGVSDRGWSGSVFETRAMVALGDSAMHLSPREQEKLLIVVAGDLARRRRDRGLKLNHPETIALITAELLESARRREIRSGTHEPRNHLRHPRPGHGWRG
jgi:hypothetical protein